MSSYKRKEPSHLCIMNLGATARPDPLAGHSSYEYTDRLCRSCLSPALMVDWAAGDRVCTNCGLVDEEHIRDDRPEWKDFNDADDLAKGLPSAARCGMVPVDESKYLGGLQPTTLSKHVYGGVTRGGNDLQRRKSLLATNGRIDYMMERQNVVALKKARVSRLAQRNQRDAPHDQDEYVRPEHDELLLHEEQDEQRLQSALYAEKWSLNRALLLHGNEHDQESETLFRHTSLVEREGERDELIQRLDKSLYQASHDLYSAYTMLQAASRQLCLPDRVLHEASSTLCQYATRRDGLSVRGVSGRVTSKHENGKTNEKVRRLRQSNKFKQIGALGSALLFLTARKLGWARTLTEVCSSFTSPDDDEITTIAYCGEVFIKPKHCSRAMGEIKAVCPDFALATSFVATGAARHTSSERQSADTASTNNFVEYTIRKLELPPVAMASIQVLVAQHRKEQHKSGLESGTKLSTWTASITLLVCAAGAALQRLASQPELLRGTASVETGKQLSWGNEEAFHEPPTKSRKIDLANPRLEDCGGLLNDLFDEIDSSDAIRGSAKFDVFSSLPENRVVNQDVSYQTMRVFDTWLEQMPWSRPITQIEQSCGVSRHIIFNHYKSNIYPRRQGLLDFLQEAASNPPRESVLLDAPLASVLLGNIGVAASLLSNKP